jgi:hypothetical protein
MNIAIDVSSLTTTPYCRSFQKLNKRKKISPTLLIFSEIVCIWQKLCNDCVNPRNLAEAAKTKDSGSFSKHHINIFPKGNDLQ